MSGHPDTESAKKKKKNWCSAMPAGQNTDSGKKNCYIANAKPVAQNTNLEGKHHGSTWIVYLSIVHVLLKHYSCMFMCGWTLFIHAPFVVHALLNSHSFSCSYSGGAELFTRFFVVHTVVARTRGSDLLTHGQGVRASSALIRTCVTCWWVRGVIFLL